MKKVAVFLAEGFEDIEALAVVDILRRAKILCDTVSIGEEYVKSSHGIIVKADKIINNIECEEYDMIVLPGGHLGSKNLSEDSRVLDIVKKYDNDKNKYIAAICAAPAMVLSAAGIENNRYITSYPDKEFENMLERANYINELVVVDENLITSRGPATAFLFAYKLVELLGGNSEELKEGMLWNMVEKEE